MHPHHGKLGLYDSILGYSTVTIWHPTYTVVRHEVSIRTHPPETIWTTIICSSLQECILYLWLCIWVLRAPKCTLAEKNWSEKCCSLESVTFHHIQVNDMPQMQFVRKSHSRGPIAVLEDDLELASAMQHASRYKKPGKGKAQGSAALSLGISKRMSSILLYGKNFSLSKSLASHRGRTKRRPHRRLDFFFWRPFERPFVLVRAWVCQSVGQHDAVQRVLR